MAFFGVEVKSAKPFTHSSDKVKGRLRISQATLGVGSATNKNLVQCNVGNKSPVILCVLIPDKTESCPLDLEFEEAEDVVFSVIGPRTVYLTGYYLSNSRKYNNTSDTESFGEDVGNSESEKMNHSTDEDEYEGSFINDEPEVVLSSPASSHGVDSEEEKNAKNKKGNSKRLKKRYQISESDEDTGLEESEDEDDNKNLLSLFNSKRTAKNESSKTVKNKDNLAVASTDETEITAKVDSESKEKTEAMNTSEVSCVNGEKPKKKRKERSKDMKISEAQSEDKKDLVVNHEKNNSVEIDELGSENGPKLKKRKRELKEKSVENEDMVKAVPTITQEEKKSSVIVDRCLTEKKTKTKKNKKSYNTQVNEEQLNISTPVIVNVNDDETSSDVRTLSNGLVIEELSKGDPNGKIAGPGKKVKVYFTAKLKESGHVFDSNVGKTPYKFRLGDEEIIEGWNLGLNGMRVGDKRRLVVPPSMGYGNQGTVENVPPNSWLVYDIELLGVRK